VNIAYNNWDEKDNNSTAIEHSGNVNKINLSNRASTWKSTKITPNKPMRVRPMSQEKKVKPP
jgi:hypothetical protein